jgi:transcriptional regulator with XRE-family HTH domain
MTIGERVTQLRSKRGMRATDLAKAASVPLSTISMLEAGIREGEGLSVRTAKKMAGALGVTLDYLCGMHEDAPAPTPPAKRPRSRKTAPVG